MAAPWEMTTEHALVVTVGVVQGKSAMSIGRRVVHTVTGFRDISLLRALLRVGAP